MGRFLRVAGLTDVGREREHNEDSFGLLPQFNLFIVADGMGGHRAGDIASQMAVHAVEDFFTATEKEDITWPFQFDPNLPFSVNRLITAIQLANNRIYQASTANSEHQGMGTTAVTMHFVEDGRLCHIAHVGDSRCYRVRGTELTQMTEDHSLINDYIRMKRVTPEEAENWPHKNVIVRALGMKESVQVDIFTEVPRAGDTYMLCSDGLTGMIKDDTIQHILMTEKDLDRAVSRLIEAANEEGGVDNISVVLARVEAT